MELTTDVLLDLHRRMVRIRLFEEAAGELDGERARLPGFLHLYVGEEAVAAGVCGEPHRRRPDHLHPSRSRPPRREGRAVRPDDGRVDGQVHRLLQGQGRVDAHLFDLDVGMLGANGIVGAGSPIAVGAGFANKYRGDGNGSPSPSSATGRPTSAPSTRQPTWPVRSSCRSCSSARTTSTASSPARQDDGDHRHRRPRGRLRDAGRHRRRDGRRRRSRSGRSKRSSAPAEGDGPVADRGQDLPLLQPPRRAEPRVSSTAPTTRSPRGARSATRSSGSRIAWSRRAPATRERASTPSGRNSTRRDRRGDRVRRGEPAPRHPTRSPSTCTRSTGLRARWGWRRDPQARLRPSLQRGGAPGDGPPIPTCSAPARTSAAFGGVFGTYRRPAETSSASSEWSTRRSASRRSSVSASAPPSTACARSSTSCSWTSSVSPSTRSSTRRPRSSTCSVAPRPCR